MLPTNRLDFIENIDPIFIQKMKDIRAMYMALDELIAMQFPDYPLVQDIGQSTAAIRAAQMARDNLEASLQYAIKTFCLLGEQKNEQ